MTTTESEGLRGGGSYRDADSRFDRNGCRVPDQCCCRWGAIRGPPGPIEWPPLRRCVDVAS